MCKKIIIYLVSGKLLPFTVIFRNLKGWRTVEGKTSIPANAVVKPPL